jgi:GT2 family glycosyltransferase
MSPGPDVLIVIPTLGDRLGYLTDTLESIRSQVPQPAIRVVVPLRRQEAVAVARAAGAEVIDDPGSLPAAINLGVRDLPDGIEFVNWLGDDDLLTPGSLARTRGALVADVRAVVAYGACEYVDDTGSAIWTSQAGRHAQWILPWGPDLIPQPGMLVRRSAWEAVGGLDESLRFAFDLDLLLKLKRIGSLVDVGTVVSMFRWHAESLTVSDRTRSLDESDLVKRRYLSTRLRRVAWAWERPVRGATRVAAWEMNRRTARLLRERALRA